ncbi:MAG: M20 family metallopeptidase [Planctomycetaceae bacterium]|nr:M20 family metallopeptidase [Planctomycetaceae bacterium]
MTEVVSLLKDLVSIPSVNPMGREVEGPEYLELGMVAYLEQFFRNLGVPYYRQPGFDGRENIFARFENPQARRTVLLDAHMDTVPVEGMIIPPFQPTVEAGRLYGRGACDVKGGMAAMLAAFARIARERPASATNIIMSCTFDEEFKAEGILYLTKLWTTDKGSCPLIPGPPDVAIMAEPTELDIVVAHRGASRWKIRTKGVACHSSQPQNGVNAIYKMSPVLQGLERYAAELSTLVKPHPLCGGATISVGRIEGGISVNTVPDECSIEIDRRVVPGENGEQVIKDVEEYLRREVGGDFEFLPPWLTGLTLSDHNNHELVDGLMESIKQVVGERKKVGVPYGTNASRTSAVGVPSVVFGPGSILQAHTRDEWISIEQLEQASEIYYRYCAGG